MIEKEEIRISSDISDIVLKFVISVCRFRILLTDSEDNLFMLTVDYKSSKFKFLATDNWARSMKHSFKQKTDHVKRYNAKLKYRLFRTEKVQAVMYSWGARGGTYLLLSAHFNWHIPFPFCK